MKSASLWYVYITRRRYYLLVRQLLLYSILAVFFGCVYFVIRSKEIELAKNPRHDQVLTTTSLPGARDGTREPDFEYFDKQKSFQFYMNGEPVALDHNMKSNEKVNKHDYPYIISNQHVCETAPWQEKPLYLVIFVTSHPRDYEVRLMIRNTWATHALVNNTLVLFALGNSRSIQEAKLVAKESELYKDIIQEKIKDANDTLKALMILKWTSKFCLNAKYMLKTSSNTLVYIPNAIREIDSVKKEKRLIMGAFFTKKSEVHRTGPWAISKSIYPYLVYPPHISGPTYVLSMDVVQKLYKTSQYVLMVPREDIYITGILPVLCNLRAEPYPGMPNWDMGRQSDDYDVCEMLNAAEPTLHLKNIHRLPQIWNTLLECIVQIDENQD